MRIVNQTVKPSTNTNGTTAPSPVIDTTPRTIDDVNLPGGEAPTSPSLTTISFSRGGAVGKADVAKQQPAAIIQQSTPVAAPNTRISLPVTRPRGLSITKSGLFDRSGESSPQMQTADEQREQPSPQMQTADEQREQPSPQMQTVYEQREQPSIQEDSSLLESNEQPHSQTEPKLVPPQVEVVEQQSTLEQQEQQQSQQQDPLQFSEQYVNEQSEQQYEQKQVNNEQLLNNEQPKYELSQYEQPTQYYDIYGQLVVLRDPLPQESFQYEQQQPQQQQQEQQQGDKPVETDQQLQQEQQPPSSPSPSITETQQQSPPQDQPLAIRRTRGISAANSPITKLAEQLNQTRTGGTRQQNIVVEPEKIGLNRVPLIAGDSVARPAELSGTGGVDPTAAESAAMPSRIALAVADPKQLRQVHLKSIPAPMLKCTECDCREHVKSPFKNQCATCFHTYE